MPLFSTILCVVLAAALPSQARYLTQTPSLAVDAGIDACMLPSWTLSNLSATYTDEFDGSASFTIANSATGQSESITCVLRFNSLCRLTGTPKDPGLQIVLQINSLVGIVSVNQTWSCNDVPGVVAPTQYVTGSADLTMICPDDYRDVTICVGETATIAGALYVPEIPAPAPEPMDLGTIG